MDSGDSVPGLAAAVAAAVAVVVRAVVVVVAGRGSCVEVEWCTWWWWLFEVVAMSVLLPFGAERRDGETRGFVGPGYYWSWLVLVLQVLWELVLLVVIPNWAMDDGCKGGGEPQNPKDD